MESNLDIKELENFNELAKGGEKVVLLLSKDGIIKAVELPEYCDVSFTVHDGNVHLVQCTIKQKI